MRTRNRHAPATLNQRPSRRSSLTSSARKCRQKFLRFFPKGFHDQKYIDWERGYKWEAHEAWEEALGKAQFRKLLKARAYQEIALTAVRIESKTNLLFSFEKMALRDAVKSTEGAEAFARGLYDLLHGSGTLEKRFTRWIEVVESLPRRQTRVLTWPLVTIFGFIAQPEVHFFLKPNVTRRAAAEYGHELAYQSRPSWEIYEQLLEFAQTVSKDLRDMKPRDMMDIQSFLWVQGSDEYEE